MKILGIVFIILGGIGLSQSSWFPPPNTSDLGLLVLALSFLVLGTLFINRSSK